METKQYRFNRKTGKIYLVGNELNDVGSSLKMIILWASTPVFAKPFAHLPIQYWVQLTFLDIQGNWCYGLLNSGATDALVPWFEYKHQVESNALQLCGLITTMSLTKIECENEYFDYSFSGVKGKPGLEERMKQLIQNNSDLLVDTSLNLVR
ncbi:hypothetical protein [Anabaena azotica]|uniref:Uncharacterized protein n=1 Tax=Anabaena azotica FACHB-119 TaxID=947527 RepID=A0ABR8CYH2_9NOST|nr:hypothetical protein [Anabaena azotica]MBD2499877.1 hypothetical protein [Anabaena azotica FACHB-119]